MPDLLELRGRIEADPFCRLLGIRLEELAAGYARLAMTVTDDMTNFLGSGHGGAVFTLADAALAAASNSHGAPAVALQVGIHYLESVTPGQSLVGQAVEAHRSARTALYDITVTDADARVVASCQGRVYRAAGRGG